jgi:hypothetical protein
MKLTFKESDNNLKYRIEFNGSYLGDVKLNIWSQKWHIAPNFKLPYSFTNVEKNGYDSSYEAGKELMSLYNFLFPEYDEESDKQEFGINLSDMLTFLKERK